MWNRLKQNRLFGFGVAGAGVMAVCCFTPALVLLFAAVGISSLMGVWLDFVLLPGLVFFLGLAVYALMRRSRAKSAVVESQS
ncbi:MAG: mercury resistance system transport protein MerF [Alphaproteobacteria bacterium]|jgi:mercuric ion transport protein|nr:mercury resistance system transport protein MerF [Alphaproteobacteria bacterium]|tara:strand:- start:428 stop:673 length:246 start_codon:yes stop_codon:yes gene_type:complete